MAQDGLQWFEAAMGAVSKINVDADVGDDELIGARCPKCEGSSFIKVSTLYGQAVGRLEDPSDAEPAGQQGGMTDLEIVAKLHPPRRSSAAGVTIAVAIPLAAIDLYVYKRVSEVAGQVCIVASAVVTVIVLLTTLRRFSDKFYHRRRRWNSLFLCRNCAQLVASSS
ncbi:MAG TPA: hypothetical protein VK636_18285 [Gemmatimonadaceae bacterium]|nr:hypothetical protein [Gemmatimonadaceae bacterium]